MGGYTFVCAGSHVGVYEFVCACSTHAGGVTHLCVQGPI